MIDPKNITVFDAIYLLEGTPQISDIQGLADEYAGVQRIDNVWHTDEYSIDIVIIRRLTDNKLFTYQVYVDSQDDSEYDID